MPRNSPELEDAIDRVQAEVQEYQDEAEAQYRETGTVSPGLRMSIAAGNAKLESLRAGNESVVATNPGQTARETSLGEQAGAFVRGAGESFVNGLTGLAWDMNSYEQLTQSSATQSEQDGIPIHYPTEAQYDSAASNPVIGQLFDPLTNARMQVHGGVESLKPKNWGTTQGKLNAAATVAGLALAAVSLGHIEVSPELDAKVAEDPDSARAAISDPNTPRLVRSAIRKALTRAEPARKAAPAGPGKPSGVPVPARTPAPTHRSTPQPADPIMADSEERVRVVAFAEIKPGTSKDLVNHPFAALFKATHDALAAKGDADPLNTMTRAVASPELLDAWNEAAHSAGSSATFTKIEADYGGFKGEDEPFGVNPNYRLEFYARLSEVHSILRALGEPAAQEGTIAFRDLTREEIAAGEQPDFQYMLAFDHPLTREEQASIGQALFDIPELTYKTDDGEEQVFGGHSQIADPDTGNSQLFHSHAFNSIPADEWRHKILNHSGEIRKVLTDLGYNGVKEELIAGRTDRYDYQEAKEQAIRSGALSPSGGGEREVSPGRYSYGGTDSLGKALDARFRPSLNRELARLRGEEGNGGIAPSLLPEPPNQPSDATEAPRPGGGASSLDDVPSQSEVTRPEDFLADYDEIGGLEQAEAGNVTASNSGSSVNVSALTTGSASVVQSGKLPAKSAETARRERDAVYGAETVGTVPDRRLSENNPWLINRLLPSEAAASAEATGNLTGRGRRRGNGSESRARDPRTGRFESVSGPSTAATGIGSDEARQIIAMLTELLAATRAIPRETAAALAPIRGQITRQTDAVVSVGRNTPGLMGRGTGCS